MATILDAKAAGARRFEGQVAVITGAGQGIGAATARRLAQEGAAIVIGDMVEESSQRVRDEIRELRRFRRLLPRGAIQVGKLREADGLCPG